MGTRTVHRYSDWLRDDTSFSNSASCTRQRASLWAVRGDALMHRMLWTVPCRYQQSNTHMTCVVLPFNTDSDCLGPAGSCQHYICNHTGCLHCLQLLKGAGQEICAADDRFRDEGLQGQRG